ncbi:MAG: sulfatase [Verrucomicrobiota bacterium]
MISFPDFTGWRAKLSGLSLWLGLAVGGSVWAATPARPNVVWIIADDLSPDLAVYGYPGVKTPHLDRLAAEGRRYQNAYVSAPVCSSSRSAFILGTYQITTGLHAHDVENPQPLAAPYRPLPALLREAGWFVTNAAAPGTQRNGRVLTKAKTHYNFAHDPARVYDGTDWRKRAPGQPFFAQYQIGEPHRPFPVPTTFDEAALKALVLPPHYPDHPLTRRDWYAYLRSVEEVDRKVGLILAELRDAGVLENTVVMFFGDNGRPMPWGKQWLTVEGLRVPLIIRGPAVATPGGVERRLVSMIDLAPTVLTLAGVPVPDWMQGRPILGAPFPERNVIFAARDRCGDAGDRIRAVISETHLLVKNYDPQLPYLNWSGYKETSYPGMALLRVLGSRGALTPRQAVYLESGRPEFELYDLRSDPQGFDNVVRAPAQAGVKAKLEHELDAWVRATGDRGALPDPATEPTLPEIQKSKRQDYQRAWKARGLPAEPTDAERLAWWERTYGLGAPATVR